MWEMEITRSPAKLTLSKTDQIENTKAIHFKCFHLSYFSSSIHILDVFTFVIQWNTVFILHCSGGKVNANV